MLIRCLVRNSLRSMRPRGLERFRFWGFEICEWFSETFRNSKRLGLFFGDNWKLHWNLIELNRCIAEEEEGGRGEGGIFPAMEGAFKLGSAARRAAPGRRADTGRSKPPAPPATAGIPEERSPDFATHCRKNSRTLQGRVGPVFGGGCRGIPRGGR